MESQCGHTLDEHIVRQRREVRGQRVGAGRLEDRIDPRRKPAHAGGARPTEPGGPGGIESERSSGQFGWELTSSGGHRLTMTPPSLHHQEVLVDNSAPSEWKLRAPSPTIEAARTFHSVRFLGGTQVSSSSAAVTSTLASEAAVKLGLSATKDAKLNGGVRGIRAKESAIPSAEIRG